jgi:hypothetical protein
MLRSQAFDLIILSAMLSDLEKALITTAAGNPHRTEDGHERRMSGRAFSWDGPYGVCTGPGFRIYRRGAATDTTSHL